MIKTIYLWTTFILGNIFLLLIIGMIIRNIISKIKMKITRKHFLEALEKSQFVLRSFEPRTQEEKNSEGISKKLTMNFKTMEVTEEHIEKGENDGKTN